MARASTVIGLTMLGAAGVGAATIPFMGPSSSSPQGIAGGGTGGSALRCSANRFATVAECQAAGHPTCRPDGTMFVPTNCSTGTSSSGSRWYNSHPIYWFGGGRSGTTTQSGGTPQTVTTTTPRPSGSGGTTTTAGGGTSSRGGFGSSSTSHGGGSGSS